MCDSELWKPGKWELLQNTRHENNADSSVAINWFKKKNTWSRASYHCSGSDFIEAFAFLVFLKSDMENTTPDSWKDDQQSRPKDFSVLGKADVRLLY